MAAADVVAMLDEDMLFDRVEVAGFKVAEFVWAASNIKPLTCTPHMTVGVDTNRLVVV